MKVERAFFEVLRTNGFRGNSFPQSRLMKFSEKLNPDADVGSLVGYGTWNAIWTTWSSTTPRAYDVLKRDHPELLRTDGDVRYASGMYVPDWIYLGDVSMESVLDDIAEFSREYSETSLGEDTGRTAWDYDDRFREIFSEVRDPMSTTDCTCEYG